MMGNLINKLSYINDTKTEIRNEMIAEGINVTENDTFRSYSSKLEEKNAEIQNIVTEQDTLLTEQSDIIEELEETLNNKITLDLVNATSDADATADDIVSGKTAYVNGDKLVGTLVFNDFDGSQVRRCESMFENNKTMTQAPFFNTENVTTMKLMFYGCTSLQTIPEYNTENVTSMYRMFYNCTSLQEIPELDTSQVTNMYGMFYGCSNLTEIHGVFNLIKVTDLSAMFTNCSALTSVHIKNLNHTGLNLSSCPLLHECLTYLINNLVETTTSKDLKLGSVNLAKLTEEEIAIANEKGWTLS